ncbi:MAG TPA: SxtJ family membrane protein [Verrucomicrobiae bacterium]|nr:SxtJ family membrane protein [Verrucomicrobiae bacterium]
MKLNLKDEPKEWRKSALMTALGLVILSSVLRWRHILASDRWLLVIAMSGVAAVCAWWQPRWFRGYYQVSMRLGFAISQVGGRVALLFFFLFILTPFGLILRLAGKDALQLRTPRRATTYWQTAKRYGPLDRLF